MSEIPRLRVVEAIGELGALDPERASSLASMIVRGCASEKRVVLDFSGVGAIASAFASALFLALAESAPLETWKSTLIFENVTQPQNDALARSIKAVRLALKEQVGA